MKFEILFNKSTLHSVVRESFMSLDRGDVRCPQLFSGVVVKGSLGRKYERNRIGAAKVMSLNRKLLADHSKSGSSGICGCGASNARKHFASL